MNGLPERMARGAAALVVIGLLGVGCSDDTPGVSAASSTSATVVADTSSTTVVSSSTAPEFDGGCTTLTSSPSQFDPKAGQYAAYLTAIDVGGRTLGFDVIQFLGGPDAAKAYQREHPDDSGGPPNGYYIVNENPARREAPVSQDVGVRLVRLQEDSSADLTPGTFEELPAYLAGYRPSEDDRLSYNPFWLTFDAGAVTAICEQYVP